MRRVVRNVVMSNTTMYLLDNLSYCMAASYSFARKLKRTHTRAFRVRESGGNTEKDIGFLTSGELDVASLLAHCGANNGFIKTWYDATGNGNDVTQTTTSKQPQIVSSGALITDGGKPTAQFDGANHGLVVASTATLDILGQNLYLNAVFSNDPVTKFNGYIISKNTDATANIQYAIMNSKDYQSNDSVEILLNGGRRVGTSNSSVTQGLQTLASVTWANNTLQCYINNVASGSSASYSSALTSRSTFVIGARADSGGAIATYFKGKISEIIILTDFSKRDSIENNQKKYFSIL